MLRARTRGRRGPGVSLAISRLGAPPSAACLAAARSAGRRERAAELHLRRRRRGARRRRWPSRRARAFSLKAGPAPRDRRPRNSEPIICASRSGRQSRGASVRVAPPFICARNASTTSSTTMPPRADAGWPLNAGGHGHARRRRAHRRRRRRVLGEEGRLLAAATNGGGERARGRRGAPARAHLGRPRAHVPHPDLGRRRRRADLGVLRLAVRRPRAHLLAALVLVVADRSATSPCDLLPRDRRARPTSRISGGRTARPRPAAVMPCCLGAAIASVCARTVSSVEDVRGVRPIASSVCVSGRGRRGHPRHDIVAPASVLGRNPVNFREWKSARLASKIASSVVARPSARRRARGDASAAGRGTC